MFTSVSAVVTPEPPYTFNGQVTVENNCNQRPICNQTLKPGDNVSISWSLTSSSGNDTCFVAIRPLSDLHDDAAYVAQIYPHPLCSQNSGTITIPQTPLNTLFPFDGSSFLVRINLPTGNERDSCSFQ
jgi:hypothetical protein